MWVFGVYFFPGLGFWGRGRREEVLDYSYLEEGGDERSGRSMCLLKKHKFSIFFFVDEDTGGRKKIKNKSEYIEGKKSFFLKKK